MLTIRKTAEGLTFTVCVQPRSSRAVIAGGHGNALKVKLTAPPVGGAANKQCIQLLAKALNLPKSAIAITSGQSSRIKQISLKPIQGNFSPAQIKSLENILHNLFEPADPQN